MRFTSQPTTQTYEGGVAYTLSHKQELIKMCLTSFLQKDYYEKESDKIKTIQDLASHIDPDFCMKLAIFSREYGLRSVNHVLFVEAAKQMYGKKGVRETLTKYLSKIVRRPDELLDIIGYYAFTNGQNFNSIILPNALKHAVSKKLSEFKDYQLAKYRGKGDAINLYDLVNMTHAKSDSIAKLVKGTLESADTWEVEISKEGNNKESWDRLLSENKLGALATIRNLRNMTQAGVEAEKLATYLDTIKWSDIFPFQAIQAIDMLAADRELDKSIYAVVEKHVKECFKYIAEQYKGKIVIGVDVSGSMFGSSVSELSTMDRAKMAVIYGQILKEVTDADMYFWSDSCVLADTDDMTVLMNAARAISSGTYPQNFTDMIEKDEYDYVIILTDEQITGRLNNVAKKQTVVWGLHDYHNTIVSGNGITYFTGYNDIMWKVGSDLFRLGELEKEIEK